MRNTIRDDKFASKLKPEDKEAIEKAVQSAIDWLEANQLAEVEEYEHQQKELEGICNPIVRGARGLGMRRAAVANWGAEGLERGRIEGPGGTPQWGALLHAAPKRVGRGLHMPGNHCPRSRPPASSCMLPRRPHRAPPSHARTHARTDLSRSAPCTARRAARAACPAWAARVPAAPPGPAARVVRLWRRWTERRASCFCRAAFSGPEAAAARAVGARLRATHWRPLACRPPRPPAVAPQQTLQRPSAPSSAAP
jgi:hypothetical protein